MEKFHVDIHGTACKFLKLQDIKLTTYIRHSEILEAKIEYPRKSIN